MQENDGVNFFWSVLLTVGGIFGVWNIGKAFKETDDKEIAAYKKIIEEKDRIIEEYEYKIEVYQKIIDNDRRKDLEQH